jgi:hypothetical protein
MVQSKTGNRGTTRMAKIAGLASKEVNPSNGQHNPYEEFANIRWKSLLHLNRRKKANVTTKAADQPVSTHKPQTLDELLAELPEHSVVGEIYAEIAKASKARSLDLKGGNDQLSCRPAGAQHMRNWGQTVVGSCPAPSSENGGTKALATSIVDDHPPHNSALVALAKQQNRKRYGNKCPMSKGDCHWHYYWEGWQAILTLPTRALICHPL